MLAMSRCLDVTPAVSPRRGQHQVDSRDDSVKVAPVCKRSVYGSFVDPSGAGGGGDDGCSPE